MKSRNFSQSLKYFKWKHQNSSLEFFFNLSSKEWSFYELNLGNLHFKFYSTHSLSASLAEERKNCCSWNTCVSMGVSKTDSNNNTTITKLAVSTQPFICSKDYWALRRARHCCWVLELERKDKALYSRSPWLCVCVCVCIGVGGVDAYANFWQFDKYYDKCPLKEHWECLTSIRGALLNIYLVMGHILLFTLLHLHI